MATILDTIADYARQRVAADKARIGPDAMRELALGGDAGGADVFLFIGAARNDLLRDFFRPMHSNTSKFLCYLNYYTRNQRHKQP